MATDQTIQALEAKVAELEQENEQLRDEAQFLDHRLADVEAELDRLGYEGVIEAEQQIEELEATLNELQFENQELTRELDRVQLEGASSSSDEETVYLASQSRQHFHRPNCKWALYISSAALIEYGSHREAVEAGKRPCKTCRA